MSVVPFSSDGAKSFPLPAWPLEAFSCEPAHGFFLRLPEKNHSFSASALAISLGLHGRDFNPQELLEFCLKFPSRFLERVSAATPRFQDKFVLLNGQMFNCRADWSISQPRVCAACLGEAEYYRNWWDLTVLAQCPFHDRPLESGRGESKLAWWYPRIGQTPNGVSLVLHDVPRCEVPPPSWERYVLGRMKITEPMSVELLDSVEIYQVIEAAELLGSLKVLGWENAAKCRLRSLSDKRAAVLVAGASVLFGGTDEIANCLRSYLLDAKISPKFDGKRIDYPMLFGGVLSKLAIAGGNQLFHVIRSEIDHAIDDTSTYIRRVKSTSARANVRLVTLKRLASQLGMRKQHLRIVAVTLGLVSPEKRLGQYISFTAATAEKLKNVLDDVVRRDEAAARLDLSVASFNVLCDAGLFVPFVRMGPGRPHDFFRKSMLDAVLERVRSDVVFPSNCEPTPGFLQYCSKLHMRPGDIILEILSGKLKVGGWTNKLIQLPWSRSDKQAPIADKHHAFKPRRVSKRPGVGKADAAAMLGATPPVVKALLRAGHLRLVQGSKASRPRIDTDSLEAFNREYAPAHIYADILKCLPHFAFFILEKLGITRLPKLHTRNASFVRRAAVKTILGLKNDPDDLPESAAGRFWKAFAEHTRKVGSSTRMFSQPDRPSIRLYSGDKTLSVVFELDRSMRWIRYELVCDPRSSSRRYNLMRQHQSELVNILAGALVEEDEKSGALIITEVKRYDLTENDHWTESFDWIEERMEYFRSIFTPKV